MILFRVHQVFHSYLTNISNTTVRTVRSTVPLRTTVESNGHYSLLVRLGSKWSAGVAYCR